MADPLALVVAVHVKRTMALIGPDLPAAGAEKPAGPEVPAIRVGFVFGLHVFTLPLVLVRSRRQRPFFWRKYAPQRPAVRLEWTRGGGLDNPLARPIMAISLAFFL